MHFRSSAKETWVYFDTNSMKLVDANANLQRLYPVGRDGNGRQFYCGRAEWGKDKVLN